MKFERAKTEMDYELLKKSRIKFPKGCRRKPIFHYTSIGGLDGILRNKTLRFTNIRYMNDKDEIFAGVKSFTKKFESLGMERKLPSFKDINEEKQMFVCCFSLNGDSLPMWNYYTKDINSQGYNIEFDNKQLVESILRTNELLNGCDISFGVVDYSEQDDSKYSNAVVDEINTRTELLAARVMQIFTEQAQKENPTAEGQAILNQINEKIAKAEKNRKPDTLQIYSYNGEQCQFLTDPLFNYLPFVKGDWFKQEQEFRIVISVPNTLLLKLKGEHSNGIYKFRISNGVMVPYLELKFSPDAIKSLTISPTIQSDLVERSMKDFLSYCNLKVDDISKFIKHSDVPVRF